MESSDLPNPLHDIHARAGAEFQAYDRLEVVSTFGDPRAEYDAFRNGAALMDLPQRGILELTGKDRLAFLNNLLTNQTWSKATKSDMSAASGVYAFFLNLKGRIVTDVNVLDRGDRTLLEMDARHVGPVGLAFDKYLFAEKVKVASRVGQLHEFALHGPHAARVLAGFLTLEQSQHPGAFPALSPSPGTPGEGGGEGPISRGAGAHSPLSPAPEYREEGGSALAKLAPLASLDASLFGFPVTIWRDDPAGVRGYHILMDASAARIVWTNLVVNAGPRAYGVAHRLHPAGWAAFNAARIEAGRPLLGIDFEAVPAPTAYPAKKQREEGDGEGNHPGMLPAETGQFARGVSITKGCYLGQEIVARMHARGQVARQIVGLQMEADHLPLAGAGVFDEKGTQVGVVTSSTISPAIGGRAIALALVKRPHFALGTPLNVPAEGATRRAVVVELPFVKGT